MKRRGFLGGMVGAAVAGPGMAKEALAKAAADMTLGHGSMISAGVSSLSGGAPIGYAQNAGMVSEVVRGSDMLRKLMGLTASQRAKLKLQQAVYALDADIASYRSISLQAKVDWQRDRNLEASLAERKSMWQRLADGLGYEDQPI